MAQLAGLTSAAHQLTSDFLSLVTRIRDAAPGSSDRNSLLAALYRDYGT